MHLPDIHIHIAEVNIHNHIDLQSLEQLIKQGFTKVTKEIDNLKIAVEAEDSAIASAVVLLNGISDIVAQAVAKALADNPGVDLTPLNDIVTDINQRTSELATAVSANTPVVTGTPAPAPAPADPPVDPVV